MRIRATVAAVSGALALSAFVVPAAHAADASSGNSAFSSAAADAVGSAADAAATLDVTFSNVKVNNGKNIVVGATGTYTVPATYTVTHPADLDPSTFYSGPAIYRGTTIDAATNMIISDDPGTCTAASTTVLNCTATIYVRPGDGDLLNSEAGTWKIGGVAVLKDGTDYKLQGDLGTRKVLRTAKLTVNAAPEPVVKGKTITVTGKLTRANWESNTYSAYGTQSVILQFRKAGTTNYVNVKGIKSSSTGALKTTTTASVDGYYRFTFAGTATTAAASVAGDYVDVQ